MKIRRRSFLRAGVDTVVTAPAGIPNLNCFSEQKQDKDADLCSSYKYRFPKPLIKKETIMAILKEKEVIFNGTK